ECDPRRAASALISTAFLYGEGGRGVWPAPGCVRVDVQFNDVSLRGRGVMSANRDCALRISGSKMSFQGRKEGWVKWKQNDRVVEEL
ncbi:hypothetical protein, partial [Bellilinea sp.]